MTLERVRGPLWMLLASVAFAAMGALVKAVSAEVPPGQIVVWRSAVSALGVLALAWHAGARLRPVNVRMHLVRGLVGVASMLSYFTAIARLPLGDAVLVTYASPLVVALLSPWTVGERPAPRTWAALVVGFAGVALVVGPAGDDDPFGVGVAIAAAWFAACAYLSIRVLTRTDGTLAIVWWFSVLSTVVASVSFVGGPAPLGGFAAGALVAIGLLGVVAQAALTRAYAVAEAAHVSVFAYATPVFAYALQAVVLRELPAPTSLAGAALVLGAGAIVARSGDPG